MPVKRASRPWLALATVLAAAAPQLASAALIGGVTWADYNGNGIRDAGEPTIGGVGVELWSGGTGLGIITTSSATSGYSFSNVPAGNYQILFGSAGAPFSPQNQGSNPALDSDANPLTGLTDEFALGSADLPDIDAGYLIPPPANGQIGGLVWGDLNFNGLFDVGESGIAGVLVSLFELAGTSALATTTTAGDGSYNFSSLLDDTYEIGFQPPLGTAFTLANVGSDDSIDSDADRATGRATVSLSGGSSLRDVDAGVCPIDDTRCGRAQPVPVPAPGSLALLFSALAGLGITLRRRLH